MFNKEPLHNPFNARKQHSGDHNSSNNNSYKRRINDTVVYKPSEDTGYPKCITIFHEQVNSQNVFF